MYVLKCLCHFFLSFSHKLNLAHKDLQPQKVEKIYLKKKKEGSQFYLRSHKFLFDFKHKVMRHKLRRMGEWGKNKFKSWIMIFVLFVLLFIPNWSEEIAERTFYFNSYSKQVILIQKWARDATVGPGLSFSLCL